MSALPLNIKLHLKGYCIETTARKKMRELTDRFYNEANVPESLLNEIELLQDFLKSSYFPDLRSSDERLSGATDIIVQLSKENGNFRITF